MNKTVLITGSARGIGRAAALRYAKEGFQIVINGLHQSKWLEDLKLEINTLGCDCMAFAGDMGDSNFTKEIYSKVKNRFSCPDILINNAGISHVGLFTETSIDDWNRVISSNLTSMYCCCAAVVPDMISRQYGKIINISSVWGCTGASCEVAYSASKGGVNAFTKALAKELAPSNIQINAIAFGAIDTDMNKCFTESDLNSLASEIPAGRLGSVEEAAEFIYQISMNGTYFTGQVITFDGGWI